MKNYFTDKEIACHCCGVIKYDEDFLYQLNKARALADIPFIVNSFYRCPKHNKEVGSKPTSSHIKGCAVDLKISSSRMRAKIIIALIKTGFTRIGIGDDFIHVDNDKDKPQEVFWLY